MEQRVIQLTPGQSPISRFLMRVLVLTILLVALVIGIALFVFVLLPLMVIAAILVLLSMGWRKLSSVFSGSETRDEGRRNVRVIQHPEDIG
ncbi:MAG: hypothetical protein H6815_06690 [Phycisphaeraceae bacterium]|nr:hypothetical protein [Phycisphaerales bacterium]MCB9860126.1 hypothetical protein [Phycisphaeraceae bacterium]